MTVTVSSDDSRCGFLRRFGGMGSRHSFLRGASSPVAATSAAAPARSLLSRSLLRLARTAKQQPAPKGARILTPLAKMPRDAARVLLKEATATGLLPG